jgi:hypothetical protein
MVMTPRSQRIGQRAQPVGSCHAVRTEGQLVLLARYMGPGEAAGGLERDSTRDSPGPMPGAKRCSPGRARPGHAAQGYWPPPALTQVPLK